MEKNGENTQKHTLLQPPARFVTRPGCFTTASLLLSANKSHDQHGASHHSQRYPQNCQSTISVGLQGSCLASNQSGCKPSRATPLAFWLFSTDIKTMIQRSRFITPNIPLPNTLPTATELPLLPRSCIWLHLGIKLPRRASRSSRSSSS